MQMQLQLPRQSGSLGARTDLGHVRQSYCCKLRNVTCIEIEIEIESVGKLSNECRVRHKRHHLDYTQEGREGSKTFTALVTFN